jgi:hypothetical protein
LNEALTRLFACVLVAARGLAQRSQARGNLGYARAIGRRRRGRPAIQLLLQPRTRITNARPFSRPRAAAKSVQGANP